MFVDSASGRKYHGGRWYTQGLRFVCRLGLPGEGAFSAPFRECFGPRLAVLSPSSHPSTSAHGRMLSYGIHFDEITY